eukprot:CAMPEP_0185521816 /NCGR_PEP_ID=MMETSP1366-20130426/80970_1 /TAXON_ID=38817 /ORGANISM="Gephyrocapsa oceanica, Strain RCC1303" /LENGTH=96 /DNA_ID=CAMNT_0028133011 /DNA_START=1 /DNA_END=289 /DNA_ORIENTATION=-
MGDGGADERGDVDAAARLPAARRAALQPTAAYRELIVPRATDVACAKLRVATVKGAAVEGADVDAAELTALCGTPLSPLPLDRFVRSAAARRDRPG